jgi:gamma-glutamyltranspeptidase/glutathione hydrolase
LAKDSGFFSMRARQGVAATTALALTLAGCGAVQAVKTTVLGKEPKYGDHLTGFIGAVVADEPRAALAAREVLAIGGNAADAAVTLGMMLSVTLPSRASLGAGGACIAYQPGRKSPHGGTPEAIMFTPRPSSLGGGDRPAAVPMLARGLYLLSARYGTQPFETMISPAEQIARDGFPVSRALATDLAVVAGPLAGDPEAAAVFAPGGRPLGEGDELRQPSLAATLTQIRHVGVGDMYQGLLAHRLAESSPEAGGPISLADLRDSTAVLAEPLVVAAGPDQAAFVPPPADGGAASAAAFQVLLANQGDAAGAEQRALAAAAAGRHVAELPALPASSSFVVLDRKGGAVACALTMDNLFGTGRIVPGTGVILGASPTAKPEPLLVAAVAWNGARDAFRAAVGASGQNRAPLAGAAGLIQAMAGELPPRNPVPDPGRVNAIGCTGYLPGNENSCRWSADYRGSGLAVGGS